ncbi:YafY family protein [Jatrophihabitans endophyticus]|uniref:helix-turn-helix transcriptional regulator n=1 Tax=Jatrophihabitans endophyticus TaxID=1206085 RepID=UPI0019F9A0D7|nr:YafY family protein [Jatrophihabitans endophyticus]MBE7189919.1 YafY family transcriptional regulator [Jatrophihabitans endophyticus]
MTRGRVNANDERLPRLLALVPYLQARPGISVAQASEDFGVGEDQLRRDLTLLWMCGLPGHGPGDLIDLSFEGETVSVLFDAGMSRPLRLNAEEALALVVALRTLAETPGLADTDAVQRALAKVEAVAGEAVHDETVAVELDDAERWLALSQRAVDEQRAVRIRYYSASRDETSERVVDPVRVFVSDGNSYLEGWCRRAEGMRVFRVDRLDDVVLLDEPAVVPDEVQLRDLSEGVFQPAAEHLLVTLRLTSAYAWIADYYPIESVEPYGEDAEQVSLRVADPAWVRALVLASAGQVTVLEPQWLVQDVRDQAARALAAYGQV